eukprot:scaffold387801_cov24-Attheya_sp.AAC.1
MEGKEAGDEMEGKDPGDDLRLRCVVDGGGDQVKQHWRRYGRCRRVLNSLFLKLQFRNLSILLGSQARGRPS